MVIMASLNCRPAGYEDFEEFGDDDLDPAFDDWDYGRNEEATQFKNKPIKTLTPDATPSTGKGGFGQPATRQSNGWAVGAKETQTHSQTKTKKPHRKLVQKNQMSSTSSTQNGRAPSQETNDISVSQVVPVDDLRLAIMKNNKDAVTRLLDQGLGVDTTFSTGWSPLMYAASSGHPEILQLLLDRGANVAFHKDMYSSLMATCASTQASENSILQCIDKLLDKGADIDAFDRYHMSALMYASREGRPLVVQRLLEQKPNLDKQDNRGYTSLMWAISRGHLRVVQLLLAAGADTTKRTGDGSTATDLAMLAGQAKVKDLLQQYAAADKDKLQQLEKQIVLDAKAEAETTVEHPEKPSLLVSSTQVCTKYGDMELLLLGMEQAQLIPLFQQHQITLHTFLRMTDRDLVQMGIMELGVRKKLLEGIHQTHRKDWETSSVPPLLYNKQISATEAVGMLINIKKHAAYIGSSIGYISDQLKANDAILRNAKEGYTADVLSCHTDEALTNVRLLHQELGQLRLHLAELMETGHYKPADLLDLSRPKGRSPINLGPVLVCTGLTVGLLVAVWKRDSVSQLVAQAAKGLGYNTS